MNNSTVAHNFAHNSETGKNGSNLFYEHNSNGSRTIYSYGYHFAIAHIPSIGTNTVYMTMDTYSNSTNRHINHVLRAISHMNIIYCPLNITQYFRYGEPNKQNLKRSVEWFERSISETVSKHINARKYSYLFNIVEYLNKLKMFVTAFKCKHLLSGKARQVIYSNYNTEQIESLFFSSKQIEAHKRNIEAEKERQKKMEANKIIAFKLFECDYLNTKFTYLRLNGEVIETSKGIKIDDLESAKKLYDIANRCKRLNTEFNEHLRFMNYTLDKVTGNGTIKIGCHTIPFKETQTIAKTLNWI